MFLKNRNIISKLKRSKVTDYAALTFTNTLNPDQAQQSVLNGSEPIDTLILFVKEYLKKYLKKKYLLTTKIIKIIQHAKSSIRAQTLCF